MELRNGIKTFHPKTQKEWRKWLDKNHLKELSVWLILYKKDCGTPTISHSQAVDEALCYGWIDSLVTKRDEDSRYQFFTRRKPTSTWSKVNKLKIEKLLAEDLIQPEGMRVIELAKKNGSWDTLNDIDDLIIPDDFQKALKKNKAALKYFEAFPPSSKRLILYWIQSAKRDETRLKRIEETIALATENKRANHPKK